MLPSWAYTVHRNRDGSRSRSGFWFSRTFDICAWFGRLVDAVLCIFGHANFIWGFWGGRSETSLKRRASYLCLKQEAKAFFHFYFKIKISVAPPVVRWPGLKHLPLSPARAAVRDFVRAARGQWCELSSHGLSMSQPLPTAWAGTSPLCCRRSPGSWAELKAMRLSTLNCWDAFSCQKYLPTAQKY